MWSTPSYLCRWQLLCRPYTTLHPHLHSTLGSRTRRGLSCFCNWQSLSGLHEKASPRPSWIGRELSSPEMVEKG